MPYLNQAGTSWPKPAAVLEATEQSLRSPPEQWGEQFRSAHAAIAAFFGIRDRSRLLLTPACTQALHLGITDLPWVAGDRILVSSLEHHALERPARLLQSRGVELTRIERGSDRPLDLQHLQVELAKGDVRLVAMTAACNVTGEILPTDEVRRMAHEHGALCLLDLAQTAGWLDFHAEESGVDMFAFAGHKGMQGPTGIGGLYVAPHVAMTSPSAACEVDLKSPGGSCSTMPGYCDAGSVDRPALSGLAAAVEWLCRTPAKDRLDAARIRLSRIEDLLRQRDDIRIVGAAKAVPRLPTLAFCHATSTPADVGRALAAADVTVGSGLQCAPSAHDALGTAPNGVVRMSVGPATTDADIDAVLSALADL